MTPSPEPEGSTGPPRSVQLSFVLWLGAAIVGATGVMVSYSTAPEIAGQLGERPGQSAGWVGIIAFVLLLLWVAAMQFMRNGHNWARIVLVGFGALGVLEGLRFLSQADVYFAAGALGVAHGVLSIAQATLVIVAVVLMFRPDANAHFARDRP